MTHKQPAEYSYFFFQGRIELGRVIAGSFKNFGSSLTHCSAEIAKIKGNWAAQGFKSIFTSFPNYFLLCFWFTSFLFSLIVTPLTCFTITIFQISVLLVGFLIVFSFYLCITLIDRIYCTIHAIITHCPVCQSRFSLPTYVCPCGLEHDRLRPGIYGILWRKCNCGAILPTTFLNNRQKLQAKCPVCDNNIKGGGFQASWLIPVVGGPSSGKTCYINMTMLSLEKNAMSKYGLEFQYEDNGLDEYKDNSSRLTSGELPMKTSDTRLRYYQFGLTPKGATKQLVSLCDVAGELYDINASSRDISGQVGFSYANAFILLIDPLAIPKYRNEISTAVSISDYSASTQRIDEMVDLFLDNNSRRLNLHKQALLNSDVAIVFTKVDLPGLENKIGNSAVLRTATSTEQTAKLKVQNELCRVFLVRYEESNFLNSLSRFKSYQFFTCSSLGHVKNGQPFLAANVEAPFIWLLKKISKVIDKTIK